MVILIIKFGIVIKMICNYFKKKEGSYEIIISIVKKP